MILASPQTKSGDWPRPTMNGWQPSMLLWRRPVGTTSGTAPMPPMSRPVCAKSAESISESAWLGIANR